MKKIIIQKNGKRFQVIEKHLFFEKLLFSCGTLREAQAMQKSTILNGGYSKHSAFTYCTDPHILQAFKGAFDTMEILL